MKHYYQICVTLNKGYTELIFWITSEELTYDNENELIECVKTKCKKIKSYKHLNKLLAVEITKDAYDKFIKTYDDCRLEYDFIVVDDTI